MLLVISPSKTQDLQVPLQGKTTIPEFIDRAQQIVAHLRGYDREALAALMKISEKLARLNIERYQKFSLPFTPANSRQALFVFQGDQFRPMQRAQYSSAQLDHGQQHLRILSGLYGTLRPLDLIQPYRLEMATKLGVAGKKNLYEFWSAPVTAAINEQLQDDPYPVLVNLASAEYFRVIRKKDLRADILTLSFKQEKEGRLRTIAIHAKRARGAMVDFMLSNRLTRPEDLQRFDRDGYAFAPDHSSADEWVFIRRAD